MNDTTPFQFGTFIGKGSWVDRKGGRGEYTCEHQFRSEEAVVDQTTKRVFLKEDGSVLYEEHSRILLRPTGVGFVEITLGNDGKEFTGDGYWLDGCCHYELEVGPENHLENTYVFGDGSVQLIGSATNNGNYTIWTERSELVPGI